MMKTPEEVCGILKINEKSRDWGCSNKLIKRFRVFNIFCSNCYKQGVNNRSGVSSKSYINF